MEQSKECRKCNQTKEIEHFYFLKTSSRYHSWCKDCLNSTSRVRLQEAYNSEEVRKKNNTPEKRQRRLLQVRKQMVKAPDKYRARHILRDAVARNKLLKLPCEKCGNSKSQGHHKDYTKPLEVVWLCSKHHGELHRKDKAISIVKGE